MQFPSISDIVLVRHVLVRHGIGSTLYCFDMSLLCRPPPPSLEGIGLVQHDSLRLWNLGVVSALLVNECSGVRRKSRSYVFVTRRRSNRAGLIMRLLITGTQSAIYDFRGGYTRKIVFQNDLHNFHNSPWLEHAIFR